MPAAAVIPAPLAYIKVVAVKKLVVECLAGSWAGANKQLSPQGRVVAPLPSLPVVSSLNRVRSALETSEALLGPLVSSKFTLRKLECSAQAVGV